MLICCCSLAGTSACYTCPTYLKEFGYKEAPAYITTYYPPLEQKAKKITKTYEYDNMGRVIKETVTEEEM